MKIRLRIAENHSLKGKRKVVKSIMAQIGNRFNVSVAEVGLNDMWQDALIGVAAVGNSESFINSVMDKVMDFVESRVAADVLQFDLELLHLGGAER